MAKGQTEALETQMTAEETLKSFLLEVVRRSCILCVRWIEEHYKLKSSFAQK